MFTEKQPKNYAMRAAGLLSVLTLLSFCINAGLYARYTTAASAADSARVAAFTIQAGETYTSAEIIFADLTPGESQSYLVTLTSGSETALTCLARISTTGNLPLTFQLNGAAVPTDSGTAQIITLEPGESNLELTLTASWPAEETDGKYIDEIDAVRLIITAEQVD